MSDPEKAQPLIHPSSITSTSSPPPSGFRDVPFLVGFLITVATICFFGVTLGLDQLKSDGGDINPDDITTDNSEAYKRLGACCAILFAVTIIMSSVFLSFLIKYATTAIRFCLKFNIAMYAVLAGVALVYSNALICVVCLLFLAISVCYYKRVQHRIPFASSNLKIASHAVKVSE